MIGSQQDPVAVVPGRPVQTGHAPGADDRRVVGRAGTEPGRDLVDHELTDAGQQLRGVLQQPEHGPRGDRRRQSPRSSIVAPMT